MHRSPAAALLGGVALLALAGCGGAANTASAPGTAVPAAATAVPAPTTDPNASCAVTADVTASPVTLLISGTAAQTACAALLRQPNTRVSAIPGPDARSGPASDSVAGSECSYAVGAQKWTVYDVGAPQFCAAEVFHSHAAPDFTVPAPTGF